MFTNDLAHYLKPLHFKKNGDVLVSAELHYMYNTVYQTTITRVIQDTVSGPNSFFCTVEYRLDVYVEKKTFITYELKINKTFALFISEYTPYSGSEKHFHNCLG